MGNRMILKSWLPVLCVIALLAFGSRLMAAKETPRALPAGTDNDFGFRTLLPDEDLEGFVEWGGSVYAGGKSGLFEMDRETLSLVRHVPLSKKLMYVKSLCKDGSGNLWLGCINGVLQYRPDTGAEIWWTRQNGLPDNRVNALYMDNAGRPWAGTWGGAAWMDSSGWHIWTKDQGLASNMVNVIREDGQGGIWFGAYNVSDGILSILPNANRFLAAGEQSAAPAPGDWGYLGIADGIPHSCITSLLRTDAKTMWVGTGFLEAGGACEVRFQQGKWEVIRILHKTAVGENASFTVEGRAIPVYGGLIGEKVRSLFLDSNRQIWLGSEYDGGTILSGAVPDANSDGLSMRWLTTETGLCNPEIKKAFEDENGNLWLATRSGITVIPAGKLR